MSLNYCTVIALKILLISNGDNCGDVIGIHINITSLGGLREFIETINLATPKRVNSLSIN